MPAGEFLLRVDAPGLAPWAGPVRLTPGGELRVEIRLRLGPRREEFTFGAARSRSRIASFFTNGARVRGLTDGAVLFATGESLAQVQNRVLGDAASAPMFTAIPGYAVFGLRIGAPLDARTDLLVDAFNLGDRNYRGIGWGIGALGRGFTLKLRRRL